MSPIVVESAREVPGVATLLRASRRDDPGFWFEFVESLDPGVPREKKWVVLVSTQSGCPVGCRFCDAGESGYRGNLSAGEILAQLREALSRHPGTPPGSVEMLKLHFARMGEPSLNPAVLVVLEHLGGRGGIPGLLPSVSTVAPRTPAVKDFFAELFRIKEELFARGRFQLQFSVHSTDPAFRRALVPIRALSLPELAELGRAWWRPGDRKLTLNFALADAAPCDPDALARIFDPERFLVKLTPVHPTRRARRHALTRAWYRPPPRVERLAAELGRRGFRAIVNPAWPQEVRGRVACGQLGRAPRAAEPA